MFDVIRRYSERGPLQQLRLARPNSFLCFRCKAAKVSRLVTVYDGDWNKLLCNGCYGRLLSIYTVKAGESPTEERVEALAAMLLSFAKGFVPSSTGPARDLTPSGFQFLATSEYVASSLKENISLDWSPAVIGLCKAVEVELRSRILDPVKALCSNVDLDADCLDRELKRVASFCAGRSSRAPELGALSHFLKTCINDKRRATSSNLLFVFTSWTGSRSRRAWLLDPNGLAIAINTLATEYRNQAAHTEQLDSVDYEKCHRYVAGSSGILWKILAST